MNREELIDRITASLVGRRRGSSGMKAAPRIRIDRSVRKDEWKGFDAAIRKSQQMLDKLAREGNRIENPIVKVETRGMLTLKARVTPSKPTPHNPRAVPMTTSWTVLSKWKWTPSGGARLPR